MRVFGDVSAVAASLLAGAVDVVPNVVMRDDAALEVKARWDRTGEGTVHVRESSLRSLSPQFKPGVQIEPAI